MRFSPHKHRAAAGIALEQPGHRVLQQGGGAGMLSYHVHLQPGLQPHSGPWLWAPWPVHSWGWGGEPAMAAVASGAGVVRAGRRQGSGLGGGWAVRHGTGQCCSPLRLSYGERGVHAHALSPPNLFFFLRLCFGLFWIRCLSVLPVIGRNWTQDLGGPFQMYVPMDR